MNKKKKESIHKRNQVLFKRKAKLEEEILKCDIEIHELMCEVLNNEN
jgi:hypothetical protein